MQKGEKKNMSETQGFRVPQAAYKPSLACLGYVDEVVGTKVSKSQNYLVSTISLKGYGASNDIKVYFTFRPEWLVSGFNPLALERVEGGDKMIVVYRNNISSDDSTPLLKGLVGCDNDKYDGLAEKMFALEIDKMVDAEDNPDVGAICGAVNSVLIEVLINEKAGERVGFILRQQSEKTGEVDAQSGKDIWRRLRWYEVNSWFNPDSEDAVKRLRTRAEKAAEKAANEGRAPSFKVMFSEDEVPF